MIYFREVFAVSLTLFTSFGETFCIEKKFEYKKYLLLFYCFDKFCKLLSNFFHLSK